MASEIESPAGDCPDTPVDAIVKQELLSNEMAWVSGSWLLGDF